MKYKNFLKKIFVTIIILMASLCCLAYGANTFLENGANVPSSGSSGNIEINEKILGVTFILGNNVNVNEAIDGTVFIFANGINVRNNINGDLMCFGNNIQIEGEVDGNAYFFGQSLNFNGKSTRDLFAFAANIIVSDKAEVLRDIFIGTGNGSINGKIGRNLSSYSGDTNIKGTIGGDVHIEGNMFIDSNSEIKGSLTQKNDKEDAVNNAKVLGEKKFIYNATREKETYSMQNRIYNVVKSLIYFVVVGILIWLIIIFLFPSFIEKGVNLLDRPLQTIGIGAIILIAAPVATIITFITVVGIPIGIIALILYGVLIYLSSFITCVVLANYIARKFNLRSFHNNFWYVLATLMVVGIMQRLPFINIFIGIFCVCVGFGVVFYRGYKENYLAS